ncbi:MAG: arginine--tRNA ligase, partial [Desulfobacterales bacterium]
KQYKMNPRQIAAPVIEALKEHADVFQEIALEGPGFINLTLTDQRLSETVDAMASDARLGCGGVAKPEKIIIDYGGANIAKPLHVGHLRSAIIGESTKRIARFLGHDVIGDVHLGDWGLQMGMVISEIERRQPDLPYFDADFDGSYPVESPVTIADLEEIYPEVSDQAKKDPEIMEVAKRITYELQQGRRGYRALWKHMYDISVADLKEDYDNLGIDFDLWLGESDTQDRIPGLIERLKSEGWAYISDGALVVDVAEPGDKKEIPPIMLVKSDGSVLYGTTDLATLDQRVKDIGPDLILYMTDGRQSDHFSQVFRSAYKTGIVPPSIRLEHIGFGTMNGKDGKPFKTREGGVMKLKDLIRMVTDKALELMAASDVAKDYDDRERLKIAHIVGVATLKFADLMNHHTKNYIFDLDRFASFEGYTGPYLLYTAVRIKSILRVASDKGLVPGPILPPTSSVERKLLLMIAQLPDMVDRAFENRAPNYLCEYAYNIASPFNNFYHEHHIMREENQELQASWLGLSTVVLSVLERVLNMLGIEIPQRM